MFSNQLFVCYTWSLWYLHFFSYKTFINWRQTHNLCLGKFTLSDLKRKIRTWTGIRTSALRISSPALYHLRYPCSHASSCSNLPLETDATLARRCGHDTICHLLSGSNFSLEIWLCKFTKAQIMSLSSINKYNMYKEKNKYCNSQTVIQFVDQFHDSNFA